MYCHKLAEGWLHGGAARGRLLERDSGPSLMEDHITRWCAAMCVVGLAPVAARELCGWGEGRLHFSNKKCCYLSPPALRTSSKEHAGLRGSVKFLCKKCIRYLTLS